MSKPFIFHQLFESRSSTYTYLLADPVSQEAVLIDPVLETVDRDLQLLKELGLKLKYVLDTHIHADHITGAGVIRQRTAAKTAVSKKSKVACVDLPLSHGDQLHFGPFIIHVIETPGHTDSCLSFYCEDRVFTGDALLIRGTGRTDFQGGSAENLYDSVTEKLFKLPSETLVYPAHDYQGFTASSVENEALHNPRLGKSKTKADFVKTMSELKLAYPQKIDEALPANRACGETSKSAATQNQVRP